MKNKIILLLGIAILIMSTEIQLFPQGTNIEAGGTMTTSPDSDLSTTFGASLAFNFDLLKISDYIMFQLRVDATYLTFDNNPFKLERIPIFVGGRLPTAFQFFPPWLVLYLEAGAEVCIDSFTLREKSGKSTLFGAATGIGFEIFLRDNLYLSLSGRYHFTKNPDINSQNNYMTFGPAFGFRF